MFWDSLGETEAEHRIDYKLDYKILKILQDNAKVTVKDIASKLNVSAPTIKNRIDEMQENGVIKGYYVEIDNSLFENVIKCFVEIGVSPEKKEELYKILNETKNVIECDRVTGEYSLIAKVIFKNTLEMDRFINKIQYYGKTRTQIIFSTLISRRGVELN